MLVDGFVYCVYNQGGQESINVDVNIKYGKILVLVFIILFVQAVYYGGNIGFQFVYVKNDKGQAGIKGLNGFDGQNIVFGNQCEAVVEYCFFLFDKFVGQYIIGYGYYINQYCVLVVQCQCFRGFLVQAGVVFGC